MNRTQSACRLASFIHLVISSTSFSLGSVWRPGTVSYTHLMAVSSFIPDRPDWALGAIAMGYALFALLWNALTAYKHVDLRHDLDWSTVLLLCGLFIVVGSLTSTGLVMDMANIISNLAKGNAFRAYITIVWMSVLVSAFVDNIPFTMAMLPTAQIVANSLGTCLLYTSRCV